MRFYNDVLKNFKTSDLKNLIINFKPESELCQLINNEIKLDAIGEGQDGEIFAVSGKRMKNKKIVVKKQREQKDVSRNIEFKERKDYNKLPEGMGNSTVVKNNIFILDTDISEYILSLLVAELYSMGNCINFPDVYDFAVCKDIHEPYLVDNYIFMEKLDYSLYDFVMCVLKLKDKNTIDRYLSVIHTQVLCAIKSYQNIGISHNDIHTGNIMIEYISKDTKYNNKKLFDCDEFYYLYDNQYISFDYVPFVVKIIDWGYGVKKYKNNMPGLVSQNTINLEKFDKKTYEEYNTPNYFNYSYDVLFFIFAMRQLTENYSYDAKQDILKDLGMHKNHEEMYVYSTFRPTSTALNLYKENDKDITCKILNKKSEFIKNSKYIRMTSKIDKKVKSVKLGEM